jgi:hypothetical protein
MLGRKQKRNTERQNIFRELIPAAPVPRLKQFRKQLENIVTSLSFNKTHMGNCQIQTIRQTIVEAQTTIVSCYCLHHTQTSTYRSLKHIPSRKTHKPVEKK